MMTSILLIPRIYAYSNFIQKYDNLDKESLTSFNLTCELHYIKTSFYKKLSQNVYFNTIIGKEFFTLHKFNLYINGGKNNKFGSYTLNTTLRRFSLYMYIEFLIYNNFKLKNEVFGINQNYYWVLDTLDNYISFANHRFFNNLDYINTATNSFLIAIFFKTFNFSNNLNYFYII